MGVCTSEELSVRCHPTFPHPRSSASTKTRLGFAPVAAAAFCNVEAAKVRINVVHAGDSGMITKKTIVFLIVLEFWSHAWMEFWGRALAAV